MFSSIQDSAYGAEATEIQSVCVLEAKSQFQEGYLAYVVATEVSLEGRDGLFTMSIHLCHFQQDGLVFPP